MRIHRVVNATWVVLMLGVSPAVGQSSPTPQPTGSAGLETVAPETLEQEAETSVPEADTTLGTEESTTETWGGGIIRMTQYTAVMCAPDIGLQPLTGATQYVIAERVEIDPSTAPPTTTVVGAQCLPKPPEGEEEESDETTTETDPAPQTDAVTDQLTLEGIPASPAGTADIPGITGLETWYWYDGPTDRTISATVAGYTTTATVTATAFRWQPCADYTPPDRLPPDTPPTDCTPSTNLSSATPGSRPPDDSNGSQAAARFTYETSGLYTLRLEVDWEGSFVFTAPDGAVLTTGSLGTVTTETTRPYLVEQIRTYLIPG